MLYSNTKVKVRSPDGDTDFFDIVAGVLQGDIFAQYLFIICLDYILWTSTDLIKENSFTLNKKGKKQSIPHTNYYGRGLCRLHSTSCNTPTQAESLLHSLQKATRDMCFHVNADQTKYVFSSRRRHLHSKWRFSEIRGEVHEPW